MVSAYLQWGSRIVLDSYACQSQLTLLHAAFRVADVYQPLFKLLVLVLSWSAASVVVGGAVVVVGTASAVVGATCIRRRL